MTQSSASGPKSTLAETSDRHVLYQESVQAVDAEVDFIDETFKALRNRTPTKLREDFCGTANSSCEWVRRRKDNTAVGVDIDPEVLAWGREHNISALDPAQQARLAVVEGDVLSTQGELVDVQLAMNFSYMTFKTRDTMRKYFAHAREQLVDDGLFILDSFGGYEAFQTLKERTKQDGFTYVWHQKKYNPITGDMLCHIHFRFPDGSRMKKAFTYHWRMWTLPELREIMIEAGFKRSIVYWEQSDEDGEGNGEFYPTEEGEPDAGWIAYLVAVK